jgi:hypothetical protein
MAFPKYRAMCWQASSLSGSTLGVDRFPFGLRTSWNSLREPQIHLSVRYVEAKDIRHLDDVARKSAEGCTLDEMIRIAYKPFPSTTITTIENTKNLVYTDFQDLPTLLEKGTLLRAQAESFVPRTLPIKQDIPEVAEEPQTDAPPEVPVTDGQDDALINLTQAHTITPEEEQSALKIQNIYRRYSLKKAPASESTIRSSRRTFFEQLAREQSTIAVEKTFYRKLFLGPLAHALLCVDHVQRWVYNSKRRAKKQLSSMKHQDLEDIRARQNKST